MVVRSTRVNRKEHPSMQRSEPSRQPRSAATIKQSQASPNARAAGGLSPLSGTATAGRGQRRTRLRVSLEPVLPDRAVEAVSTDIRYGYDLRLRNGHRLSSVDPLLEVFGVRIDALKTAGRSPELQQPEFNPGRQVQLVAEHDHDGGQAVGVWDLDRQARAGRLAYESAQLVLAASGQEVAYKGVMLDEIRSSGPEIRVSSRILVYAEQSLALDCKRLKKYIGPASQRRKLLLVVEASGRVQWWDYAGDVGPALLECLVPSLEVSKRQELLIKAARKLRRTSEKAHNGHKICELAQSRSRFDRRAQQLWMLVRHDLTTEYLVGYTTPHLPDPIWAPDQLQQDCSEEDGSRY
jgi:hypothetical protein